MQRDDMNIVTEFFNVLNRPSFAVPITPDNTGIFDPPELQQELRAY